MTRRMWLGLVAMAAGMVGGVVGSWGQAGGTAGAAATRPGKVVEIVKEVSPAAGAKRVEEKELAGYLMVYFKDETHGVYFATSADGYTFTDVNGGQPVVLGKDVAEQKGVRDPHIMRGPDGAFYLAMTDLHIYAQREGLRETLWERPAEKYEWGNNRGLVLMKSYDLIHWTHSIVRVNEAFPEMGEMGCAWAPETIFDEGKGKLMVYFTTRMGTGKTYMVYSYADDAFTKLETKPERLFTYPNANVGTLDGDITKVGDTYHLFYVAQDRPQAVKHAASKQINGGYVYEAAKVDPETVACEAPTLWKRNGTERYVLMVDVFRARPMNMGFSETTDFEHYKNLGHFNGKEGVMKTTNFSGPKHGAVVSLTAGEMERLRGYFGG